MYDIYRYTIKLRPVTKRKLVATAVPEKTRWPRRPTNMSETACRLKRSRLATTTGTASFSCFFASSTTPLSPSPSIFISLHFVDALFPSPSNIKKGTKLQWRASQQCLVGKPSIRCDVLVSQFLNICLVGKLSIRCDVLVSQHCLDGKLSIHCCDVLICFVSMQ